MRRYQNWNPYISSAAGEGEHQPRQDKSKPVTLWIQQQGTRSEQTQTALLGIPDPPYIIVPQPQEKRAHEKVAKPIHKNV